MTILEQIQKIREELSKLSDEELRLLFSDISPEVAARYAPLERFIREGE